MDSKLSVVEFYSGKSVFITGGTGFVGKVLVEKLLRDCSGLDKIYLLIRSKRSLDATARIKDLLLSPVFDNLRETNEDIFEKVVGIEGDILKPHLGLSEEDTQLLIKKVGVVFHVASSIRFDDTLTTATKINVLGTQKILALCHRMDNLQAMVYVSTAFSNCDKKFTGETVYPNSVEPHKVISLVDWMKEDTLQLISNSLVGKKITTYHLTKSISEEIISNQGHELPTVVVRPSLVVGGWKEPITGYTETMYHINGILIGAGRGVFRVMHCDPSVTAEIIPVDVVVNLLIASAWFKAMNIRPQSETTFLNCVSGIDNQLTFGKLREYALPVLRNKPLLYPIWYPNLAMVKNKYIAMFWVFFLHWIPAVVLDALSVLTFQKPRLMKVMRKISKTCDITAFFLNNNFDFTNDNVKCVWKSMSQEDRDLFYFNLKELSWQEYFRGYFMGCKQFVVKEKLSTLPKAKKQMMCMRWIYYGLLWLLLMPLMAVLLAVII